MAGIHQELPDWVKVGATVYVAYGSGSDPRPMKVTRITATQVTAESPSGGVQRFIIAKGLVRHGDGYRGLLAPRLWEGTETAVAPHVAEYHRQKDARDAADWATAWARTEDPRQTAALRKVVEFADKYRHLLDDAAGKGGGRA